MDSRVKFSVGVSAVCLCAVGLAFLFAGEEVARAVFGSPVAEPAPSLLGAAFLGFASMNWIARHHILGGIYGRSVIAANQTHLVIGAITLVKYGFTRGGTAGLWTMALLYVAGAVLFTTLGNGRGLPAKP